MVGVWSMTGQELSDRADRIAENSFLKLIGRLGMASAFPVLIAMSTWVGTTLWSLNTEQAKLRGELTGRIDVLTERVGTNLIRSGDVELGFKIRDQRIEFMERTIIDHGKRIYQLEQK
jgi:hypothetical protein